MKRSPMKRSPMWCLLVLLFLVDIAFSQASNTGVAEQAVAALEQKWLQGEKTNNPDLIAPLLAETIVDTESDGKVYDKAGLMAMTKAMKYTTAEYEGLKVTVFRDTAIATGGFKGTGTDGSGKPFDVHFRWTDTWVKMPNGQWQCVATQGTTIKM